MYEGVTVCDECVSSAAELGVTIGQLWMLQSSWRWHRGQPQWQPDTRLPSGQGQACRAGRSQNTTYSVPQRVGQGKAGRMGWNRLRGKEIYLPVISRHSYILMSQSWQCALVALKVAKHQNYLYQKWMKISVHPVGEGKIVPQSVSHFLFTEAHLSMTLNQFLQFINFNSLWRG